MLQVKYKKRNKNKQQSGNRGQNYSMPDRGGLVKRKDSPGHDMPPPNLMPPVTSLSARTSPTSSQMCSIPRQNVLTAMTLHQVSLTNEILGFLHFIIL